MKNINHFGWPVPTDPSEEENRIFRSEDDTEDLKPRKEPEEKSNKGK